jgi:DNA-binding FrmR family transcriptional regulator
VTGDSAQRDEPCVADVVTRLRRADGQLRGVIRMLEEGCGCADVVTQLAAASRAIDRAGFRLVASGLRQCASARQGGATAPMDEERLERVFLSLA